MNARSALLPVAAWLLGMAMSHSSMIFSGFDRIQGNEGDSRFCQYMLEHGFRWLGRQPHHERLWDPPIFYPARNTGAYSELLLGAGPPYWIWRAFGVPRDCAFGLWMLSVSTLNFWAAWLLLRRGLRFGVLPCSFGSLLFAFASTRIAHLGSPQLLAGYYPVLAVLALIRVFESPAGPRTTAWIGLSAACFTAQFYTGFYIAWHLAFALAVAVVWCVAHPPLRAGLAAGLRQPLRAWIGAAAASAIALLPFILHSLQAAREVGARQYDEAELYLPRLHSWVFEGSRSWIYGGLAGLWPFNRLPAIEAHAIGFGLLAPVLIVLGLRSQPPAAAGRILGATALILMAVATSLPGGLSAWPAVFFTVPGAQAVRAVCRIAHVLLIPAAVGAAAFAHTCTWRKPFLAAILAAAILEQGQSAPSYDRAEVRASVAAVARQIEPGCEAFVHTSLRASDVPVAHHLDAMEASLETRIPTLNGYSGAVPPGWVFDAAVPDEVGARDRFRGQIRAWALARGLDPERICWVRW